MENMNKELMEFINKTPNAYNCIDNIKQILNNAQYKELYENENWDIDKNGKYYVVRADSSLIAFDMATNNKNTGFNITATHVDSPAFSIKPNPIIENGNYIKLNTEGYGGMIIHTWLDRPLSIAGRVICKDKKGTISSKIINVNKNLLIIPSQAIHIDREVNQKCSLNKQVDMLPIMSLNGTGSNSIQKVISNELDDKDLKILDYDLYLYNRDEAKICGENNEFLLSPRLDDLASLYPALKGFLNGDNEHSINVFCAFNNEEIGSGTKQGADSNFLLDTLTRIAECKEIPLLPTLSNSFIVSADNAHAIHPNAASKSDPTNIVELNKGIVIKHHTNYTTDSLSSALFKEICENGNIPYQDFACKSDMPCGATLGGVSNKHVGIDSVDIGIAQLAMHSANEMIGTQDPEYMYKALKEFYSVGFFKEKNKVKMKK